MSIVYNANNAAIYKSFSYIRDVDRYSTFDNSIWIKTGDYPTLIKKVNTLTPGNSSSIVYNANNAAIYKSFSYIRDVDKYSTFDNSIWIKTGDYPTLIKKVNTLTPGNSSSIVYNANNAALSIPGSLVNFSSHYKDNGFNYMHTWIQQEGVEPPRLIWNTSSINKDLGIPLTHNMTYTYVVPHINGTMSYMGITWKSRGYFFILPKPPAQGMLNQEVTYSIPNSDLIQRIDNSRDGVVDVVWFASGVRDVEGAGGFGTYNNEKSRTLKVGAIASATVNFYFTQPHMIPSKNYKASISTPEGILDVGATLNSDVAVIRFTVNPGINMGLELVNLDNVRATKVRVMTEHGVMALASWEKYNNPILEVG